MTPAELLAKIIAQQRPVASTCYSGLPALRALTQCGLLKEAGVAQSVHCDDCDIPHEAEVVHEGGAYGYYCPELGFMAQDRSDLALLSADIPMLVSQVSESLSCTRRKSSPIHGETWLIGLWQAPAAEVMLYFQPGLRNAEDLRALKSALATRPRSEHGVVLTAEGGLEVAPFRTLRIADCLSFDDTTGAFQFDGDLAAITGLPAKNKGGRPNQHKERVIQIARERQASGLALKGQNKEAKEILATYGSKYPEDTPPSRTTLKRYLVDFRGGP